MELLYTSVESCARRWPKHKLHVDRMYDTETTRTTCTRYSSSSYCCCCVVYSRYPDRTAQRKRHEVTVTYCCNRPACFTSMFLEVCARIKYRTAAVRYTNNADNCSVIQQYSNYNVVLLALSIPAALPWGSTLVWSYILPRFLLAATHCIPPTYTKHSNVP